MTKEPLKMHKAKCHDCGIDIEVPFETKGRPVWCRRCFQKYP